MRIRHVLTATALACALAACGQSGDATSEPAASDTTPADATPADPGATTNPAATPEGTAPGESPTTGTMPDATATTAAGSAPGATDAAAASGQCATQIEANDMMQYSTKAIEVPASCTEFSITLKHTGTMPVAAMGHNLVIAKAADMQAITNDGVGAPVEASHLKAGDTRVIAHTKMIGGGETTAVTFPVAKLKDGGPFSFFCTFPGHLSMMQGTIAIK